MASNDVALRSVGSAQGAEAPAAPRPSYWREVFAELRRDRLIYAVMGAYALAAWGLAHAIGRPEAFAVSQYLPIWLRGLGAIAGLYVIVFELPASIRADPAAPLGRLRRRLPEALRPRPAGRSILLLCLPLLMGVFTSVKNMLPFLSTFHSDPMLARLDQLVHGGWDPWILLQPVMGHHVVTRAVQVIYAVGWMAALLSVPAIVALSPRLEPVRRRFFLTYVFCWVVLGNIMAGLFLSGGPIYFGRISGDFQRFAAQSQYLSFSAGRLHSSFDIQRDLWDIHMRGASELGSGISAFPSMHVAMATLFFLLGASISRGAGAAGGAFLAVILAGSVHLGWHYAIDGYVSLAITTAAWFAIGAWDKARRPG